MTTHSFDGGNTYAGKIMVAPATTQPHAATDTRLLLFLWLREARPGPSPFAPCPCPWQGVMSLPRQLTLATDRVAGSVPGLAGRTAADASGAPFAV